MKRLYQFARFLLAEIIKTRLVIYSFTYLLTCFDQCQKSYRSIAAFRRREHSNRVWSQFLDHRVYWLTSEKTEVVSQPQTVSVDKFLDAKFNCTSTTDVDELHLLNITWSHYGRPISNDSRHLVTQTMTSQGGHGYLRLYNVRGSDNGRYQCTASNELDSATSQPAYLLIKGYIYIFLNLSSSPKQRRINRIRYDTIVCV